MKYIPAEKKEWSVEKGYKKSLLYERLKDLHCPNSSIQLLAIESNIKVFLNEKKTGIDLFYVLKGRSSAKINEEVFHIHEGDLLICEPEEIQSIENPYDEIFECMIFKSNGKLEALSSLEENHDSPFSSK